MQFPTVATAAINDRRFQDSAFGAIGANPRFVARHLLWPLAAALAVSGLMAALQVDFWWADRLFAAQGHAWNLRSHPLTEGLLHKGGKDASAILWLLVVAGMAWSCIDVRRAHWRRPLAYLVSVTVLAALLVAGIKSVSGMDCPWDLARYGGDRAFVGLFESRPTTMPPASCFPAGQASAGYAWVTLYFFFLVTRPRLRWAGLALALLAGTTLGFGQQLRGAHFVSHDLWTLVVCWLVALSGYALFFRAGWTPTPDGTRAAPSPAGAVR